MKKTFYLRHKSFFDKFDGLFLHNPVLARGLVVSPVIVASYSLKNSMILGIGFMIITFFTVIISSFISKKIPYTVRIILYTLIASIIFIPTAMLLDYIYPDSIFKLGIFLPLLIANSLIGVKSESRFHKHKKGEMVLDVLCNVIGFFAVIVAVGITRELFGSGTFNGKPVENIFTVRAILLPFSGFIIIGFLAAFVKKIKNNLENPKPRVFEEE